MELLEAIKSVVRDFGKDVIAEKRFVYMIADYYSFRDNPAEKRVLSTLVNEGYAARLLKIDSSDDVSIIMNNILNDVSKNFGFRWDLVLNVVSCLMDGLNLESKHLLIEEKSNSFDKEEGVINYQNAPEKYYLKYTIEGKYHKELVVYDASGYYNSEDKSFLILKGSILGYQDLEKDVWLLSNDKLIRKKIIDQYCHLDKPYYVVDTDIKCATPTQAYFIVTGTNQNGMTAWKDSYGKSIFQNLTDNRNNLNQVHSNLSSCQPKEKTKSYTYSEEYILSLYPLLFQDVSYHAHMDFDIFQNKLQMDSEEAFLLFKFLKGMGVYIFNPYSDDYDMDVESVYHLREKYRNYIVRQKLVSIPLTNGNTIKRINLEAIIKRLYKFKNITVDEINSMLSSLENSKELYDILQRLKVIDYKGRSLNPYLTPEAMVDTIITKILYP